MYNTVSADQCAPVWSFSIGSNRVEQVATKRRGNVESGGRKGLGWGVSVANKFFVFIVHKAWALAHQKGELFVDGPHGHKIIFVVF
jgi:hypothetical protein